MRAALLGLLVAMAVGAGGLAHGQSRGKRDREAQALYQKGLRFYNLAEYDKAIEAFRAAYELSEAPRLLYNIAQAYRLKGDCPQALRFYKNFLREQPAAPNRGSVEGLVAEMEKCARPHKPTPTATPEPAPPTPKPTPPPEPKPEPALTPAPAPPPKAAAPAPAVVETQPAPVSVVEPPRPTDRGHTTRVMGLITAGAGVALIGTAVYFGLQASSSSDEVTRLFQMHGTWDSHYQQVEADGQSADMISKVLYGVGGAAVVGGALLYYLGVRSEARAESQVGLGPLPGGARLVWSCRF